MYNINANNDKNEVAQKTAEFIDERIGIISKELGSTEQDLEISNVQQVLRIWVVRRRSL